MLHYYKFNDEVAAPRPAREIYEKRSPGKGWPEECPPLRAANSFGWDITAAFDMKFVQNDGVWTLENPRDIEADWLFEDDRGAAEPETQRNAWFWEERQELPHEISPDVYRQIRHQVKVSSYLYLRTDPNELLYMTDIPNRDVRYRALSAVIDTDWYPASYPWHCVLELDKSAETVSIEQGEPICRLFIVQRDHYFAREMNIDDFERFFQRGQQWLHRHGRGESREMLDITRTYVKQQVRSTFNTVL